MKDNFYKSVGRKITCRDVVLMSVLSMGYLILSFLLIGFKPEQLFLLLVTNSLYFFSLKTRKFLLVLLPFIIFWILFDYMKAFPNYQYNSVSIEALFDEEKRLFGFDYHGNIITPNEYFLVHHYRVLDVLTGLCYLSWVPVPLALTAYLFFTNREDCIHFSFTFFLVNLLGFVIYYLYPAAPPWYVQLNGFNFYADTAGNPAGLARFDSAVGFPLFHDVYQKSSNVFAAMPSLHAAYPLIVFYFGLKNKLGKINILFALLMVGIWFSAVYNSHHYILDLIAGIVCAFLGIGLYQLINKNDWVFKKILSK